MSISILQKYSILNKKSAARRLFFEKNDWDCRIFDRSYFFRSYLSTTLYTTTAGGKNRHGHFHPSPAPVVYKISGPMGGGFLYTTGAEAENSAVKFSKNQYHRCSGGRTVPTKRLFKENAPFISFVLMGSFARTLFSQTLLP